MCWCLRVYWTVLHNLFARFITNIANSIYNNDYMASCCCHSWCCCCCVDCQHEYKQAPGRVSATPGEVESGANAASGFDRTESQTLTNHDYVIVDDCDANYLEIEHRKIETESYYLIVDRATAEDMLSDQEDGACLVRPYKEMDVSIKYIVSIYAQQQYFHIFIRQIDGRQLYSIGQHKPHEKLFNTPSDIIDFYSHHMLQCTNKNCSINLTLKPIVV